VLTRICLIFGTFTRKLQAKCPYARVNRIVRRLLILIGHGTGNPPDASFSPLLSSPGQPAWPTHPPVLTSPGQFAGAGSATGVGHGEGQPPGRRSDRLVAVGWCQSWLVMSYPRNRGHHRHPFSFDNRPRYARRGAGPVVRRIRPPAALGRVRRPSVPLHALGSATRRSGSPLHPPWHAVAVFA